MSASLPLLPDHVSLLLASLPLPRQTSILDVGANPINEAPYSALLRAGACRVTGFEPQPSAFAELQRIKGPQESYHPHAVGDGSLQTLHIYASSGLTSIFPPHLPGLRALGRARWARVLDKVEMQTLSLDRIEGLAPCDLLKIDIQGGEKLVFDHATRVLGEAVAVIVELRYMQLYEGEPMTGGVDESLRAKGFMLHKFLFNKSQPMPSSQAARLHRRRNADQLIDGDAVYLRHPGRIDSFTDGQVMQLAILAAGVIESHSLALYALDELVRRALVPADLPGRYVDALPAALLARAERAEAAQDSPAITAPPPPPAIAGKARSTPAKPAAPRAKATTTGAAAAKSPTAKSTPTRSSASRSSGA